MRLLFILLLFTVILHSTTVSLAHENQLSGLLYIEPQTPSPNEPFTITFELYDPEGAFIPEAILDIAIPELELQQSFIETSQTGIYEMKLSLPEGTWFSDLTEATFENESNTVHFGLKVGEKNLDTIEILFPELEPQRSQTSWLVFFCCLAVISLAASLSYRVNSNKLYSYLPYSHLHRLENHNLES